MALIEKDLSTILNRLSDVRARWYNIGIELGLTSSVLDSIKKECREDTIDCLTRMILCWLNSSDESLTTWSAIVRALRQPIIAHECGALAADIEKEFCQVTLPVHGGKKRTRPSTGSEGVLKRPQLEESCCECTCSASVEAIKKQLDELTKQVDNLMQSKKTQMKYNEELRRENAALKLRCEKLEDQVKEHSEQLEQLSVRPQTELQIKMCDKKGEVLSQFPKLSPEQSEVVDKNCLSIETALYSAAAEKDWYLIGYSLEVSLQFLDTIKSIDSKRLHWVLRKWLTDLAISGSKDCLYCKLVEALQSDLLEGRYQRLITTLDETWDAGCPEKYKYPRFHPF